MTRKEKIQQSALELYPPIYSSSRERDAYIQGAEWADEHPSKETIENNIIDECAKWIKNYFYTVLGESMYFSETVSDRFKKEINEKYAR